MFLWSVVMGTSEQDGQCSQMGRFLTKRTKTLRIHVCTCTGINPPRTRASPLPALGSRIFREFAVVTQIEAMQSKRYTSLLGRDSIFSGGKHDSNVTSYITMVALYMCLLRVWGATRGTDNDRLLGSCRAQRYSPKKNMTRSSGRQACRLTSLAVIDVQLHRS